MLRKSILYIAGVFLLASCSNVTDDKQLEKKPKAQSQPNIVFLLVDDLGLSSIPYYADPANGLSGLTSRNANGRDSFVYELPNITAFAKESRVYTHMYATPLCAPSRGELITGRYPFRNGIVYPAWDTTYGAAEYHQNNLNANNAIIQANGYLDTRQVGYPAVLQAMGYHTVFGGKWNLRFGQTMCQLDGKGGGGSTSYMDSLVPLQKAHLNAMGLEQTFGPVAMVGNTMDYYPPQMAKNKGPSKQYLPNALHDWMETALIEGRASGSPQYIHYCFGLIHDPFGGPVCQDYGYSPPPSDTGEWRHAKVWADKAEEVDLLIGQFVKSVDSLDRANGTSTLIILAGDNGTEATYYSMYNRNWVNGDKSTNLSNGSRVPFMVRWPGNVKPGIDPALADFSDIFPTMVELVGGAKALDSLVNIGNPNYKTCYKGGANPKMDSLSYVLDGQSMLYEMTDGKFGAKLSPREAVYAQFNNEALLANEGYKLGIQDRFGFFGINDQTLADSAIKLEALIPDIGKKAMPNPFSKGSTEYENYERLVRYYNSIFPNAVNNI